MSFESVLQDTVQDDWAEIYLLNTPNGIFRYTSYHKDINYDGNVFTAIELKRNNWSVSTKIEPQQLKLTIGLTSDVLAQLTSTAVVACALVIRRVLLDNHLVNAVVYRGDMVSIVVVNNGAEAVFESSGNFYRMRLPNYLHQSTCNHVLYDNACGLSKLDYMHSYSDVTISNNTIVHAGIASQDDDYFSGGMAEVGNQYRMVTKHTGNTVWLHVPFYNVESGVSVKIYAGCDKKIATCKNKFSNFQRFLGFPYIPSRNPTIYGV